MSCLPDGRRHLAPGLALCVALSAAALPVLAQTCALPPYDGAADPALAALLDSTLPLVARYPVLADALGRSGPAICLSDSPSEARGWYEPAANRVVIAAALDPDLQRAILIHEIRHVDQVSRGICPDLSLSMSAYARATWAMEADASAISLIVAWDLRESGDPGPWDALAGLPRHADISQAFATALAASGDISSAGAAAFDAWYASEDRREAYYIASCSAYLDEQDRRHALPGVDPLDEMFFDRLCVLPDGTPFSCAEPAAD